MLFVRVHAYMCVRVCVCVCLPQTLDCNTVTLDELEFTADFTLKITANTFCTVSNTHTHTVIKVVKSED